MLRWAVPLSVAALAAACGTTAVSSSHLAISAAPQALDFGSQTAGTQSSKSFTLRNDGVGTLAIAAVTLTGDTRGAFAVGATPKTLSGGSSAVVQVTYSAPAAEGADGATLHVSSNADNAPDLALSLSARSALACLGETDGAFCLRLGKNCGQVSAADNCGVNRTVSSCGACTSPQLCSGGVANVCTTPAFAVTVSLAGTGNGSIASTPVGISCGATCTASFASGTSVTLTPTATGGSVFAGFSGACSGQTCTLAVDAAKSVSASFARPTVLVFTQQPTNATSGAAFSPQVTVAVEDGAGVVITNSTATITLTPSAGALSGAASATAVNGVATFSNLSMALAGTYTLTAASASLTSATSSAFTISAGAASKLAFGTQPTNTVANQPVSPAVTVKLFDAAGNLTTSTATVALATSPSTTLSGTTSAPAVGGVATFSALSIAAVNLYTLAATSGSLTPATSSAFAVTAAATWTTGAPMPTARYGPPAGVIAGKLYVAGGCCVAFSPPYPRFSDLQAYDPGTNGWSTLKPIPLAVYGAPAGVINSLLYVPGGQADQNNGANVATLQVYDPATDAWTTKAPLPAASSSGAGGVINGKLYVAGGMNPANTSATNTLLVYDPAANTWTGLAPLPTPRIFAGSAVINGILYVVGGSNDSGTNLKTVEAYNPATNTWATLAPMPTARSQLGAGAIGGILYAVGGTNAAKGLATVEAYDPGTNAWSAVASLPTPTAIPAVGVINNLLYAVGGYGTGSAPCRC